MANNASVERFKRLTRELRQEVREAAIAELNKQADALVATMESVAPVHEGVLVHTIRKIPGKSDTQVRIVAGGDETTRNPSHVGIVRSAARKVGIGADPRPYNYARADEFGTVHMSAHPFFFPTYRLMKKQMISAMKRKITAAIKKRSAE